MSQARRDRRANKNQEHPEEDQIVNISKAEQVVEDNYKKILLGFLGVIALAAIFFFINHSKNNNEEKAQVAAYQAQDAFNNQEWQTAIDEFTPIAKKYGKTNIGNTSHYYLGVSYMKTGEFQKAIDEFKQYKKTSDPNINGLVEMNLGDAYMELDQSDEAITHYKRAANTESEAFQADFLLRYAMAQFRVNDLDGAKASFKRITDEFGTSSQAKTAELYLVGL